LKVPPPPHLRCRRRSKVGWGGGTHVPAEGPRWGGKVDLAKVTLGVRVVPPPVCTHANNIPDCLAEPSGRFSKNLRTVELSIRPESRRRQMPRHRRCGPNLTLAYQKLLSLMNSITGVDQPAGRRAPVVVGPMVPPKSRRRQTPRYRRCGPLSDTLPLTLGVPKFNRYRLNMMKGTTLDSGIVYLRGKSFQAFSISGTALQRAFKAV